MTKKLPPTRDDIRQIRKDAGLSQSAAAELIYSTLRTWQDWEYGKNPMHPAIFELFCDKTKAMRRKAPR